MDSLLEKYDLTAKLHEKKPSVATSTNKSSKQSLSSNNGKFSPQSAHYDGLSEGISPIISTSSQSNFQDKFSYESALLNEDKNIPFQRMQSYSDIVPQNALSNGFWRRSDSSRSRRSTSETKQMRTLYKEDLQETYHGLDIASFKSIRSSLRSKNTNKTSPRKTIYLSKLKSKTVYDPYHALSRSISSNQTTKGKTIHNEHIKTFSDVPRSKTSLGYTSQSFVQTRKRKFNPGPKGQYKFSSQDISTIEPVAKNSDKKASIQLNRMQIHSADPKFVAETYYSKIIMDAPPENIFSPTNLSRTISLWDTSPVSRKSHYMAYFYKEFKDISTFKHLENALGHYTLLLFTRFVAFIRMQYLHRKKALFIQLKALELFLTGQKYLLQFLEVGGSGILMDIFCDVKQYMVARMEAQNLLQLIFSSGRRFKELILDMEEGLASFETVSLYGKLSEAGISRLQTMWIELCLFDPHRSPTIQNSLSRILSLCQHILGVYIPNVNDTSHSEYATIDIAEGTELRKTLSRSALMVVQIFREIEKKGCTVPCFTSLAFINSVQPFLLFDEFPPLQTESTELLLQIINANKESLQLHISGTMIEILSSEDEDIRIRNLPGYSLIILELLKLNNPHIVSSLLNVDIHILLFEALKVLNPLDYVVDTVKNISEIIHILYQFADPVQSDLISESVSIFIGREYTETIESNSTFSTEFALGLQDVLLS